NARAAPYYFARVKVNPLFGHERRHTMEGPDPTAHVLRGLLLIAVLDGADRLLFRAADGFACELTAWVAGAKFEMVPPFAEDLQALPGELGRLEPAVWRWWHGLTRWFQRIRSGVQSGRFRYTVGSGSVSVHYVVKWRARLVSEVEVTLPAVPE